MASGPRRPSELAVQEALFLLDTALVYRSLKRPRGREIDVTVAAWSS
jgi:hypothetical protein